jgi:ribonuclease HI
MRYYAVRKGRVTGIYETWEECEQQIKYFKNAQFKKFKTKKKAIIFMEKELLLNKLEAVFTDKTLW